MPSFNLDTVRKAATFTLIVAVVFVFSWEKAERIEIAPQEIAQSDGVSYRFFFEAPKFPFYSPTDTSYDWEDSSLMVLENDIPLRYPHSLHSSIRSEGGGRYSHWGIRKTNLHYLMLSASDSSDLRSNGRSYVMVRPIGFSPLARVLTLFICGGIGLLLRKYFTACQLDGSGSLSVKQSRFILRAVLAGAPLFAFAVLLCAIVSGQETLGPFTYAQGTLGWSLEVVAAHYYGVLPGILIGAALCFYVAPWLFRLKRDAAIQFSIPENFRVLFFISIFLSSIFYFSGAKIAHDAGANPEGAIRMSFLGGTPYSDAAGHLECAQSVAATGRWKGFCSRRPAAASFRAATYFIGGKTEGGAVFVQNLLLSAALAAVATLLFSSFGVVPGLVFSGITLLHAERWSSTMMSEQLGFIVAVLAVGVMHLALRRRSLSLAGFSLPFMSAMALFVRMGAMFTLPAIAAWAVFSRRRFQFKGMAGAAALAMAAILLALGVNVSLNKAFGQGGIGGNFSYSLYGMSVGKDWSAGVIDFPSAVDEEERTKRVLAAAIDNIKKDPGEFVREYFKRGFKFAQVYPSYFLFGYQGDSTLYAWQLPFLICLAFGVAYTLRWRFSMDENVFLALYLLGVLASGPFLIGSDPLRAVSVSTIYIAYFCAYYFRLPIDKMKTSEEE